MFIGREREIRDLRNTLAVSSATMVYGMRRVGKTALIKHVLAQSGYDYVYFECLKADEVFNVGLFIATLREHHFDIPDGIEFRTFISAFHLLKGQKPTVFVIDEYSFLKEYYLERRKSGSDAEASRLDSEFKTIIDEELNGHKLILCGSSISAMATLLESKNPLYGRLSTPLHLRELDYLEVARFFPDMPRRDVLGIYAVFGGLPAALINVRPDLSLEENIKALLLEERSQVRSLIQNEILLELGKEPELAMIMDALRNGQHKYGEIESMIHEPTSGLLDKRLKKLLSLGLIEKRYPIGKEQRKNKVFYVIKSNLLRFYYAYLFRNFNRLAFLGPDRFFEQVIQPSLTEFVSLRFEYVLRDYFHHLILDGNRTDIADVGTYFGSECEFDAVFLKTDGTYAFYEAKFYNHPMSVGEIRREAEQVRALPAIEVSEIGFACSGGFERKPAEFQYLTLKDIFFES